MNTKADKTQENKNQSMANDISQKQSGGESTFQFVDNRPEAIFQRNAQNMANISPQVQQAEQLQALVDNRSATVVQRKIVDNTRNSLSVNHAVSGKTLQRVEIKAGEGELEAQEQFQIDCDVMYGMLKSEILSTQWMIKGLTMSKFDDPKWDGYLAETFTSTYGEKKGAGRKDVIDNLKIRAENERIGSIKLSEDGDIADELSALKACVITALLYSEGGSFLGAKSVEGLHTILIGRFPDTYGQYSDENVIPLLYGFFGYKKHPAAGKVKDEVTKYTRGMISVSGHMIGFSKKGPNNYELRDNEGNAAKATTHKHGNKTATEVWTK